MNQAGSEGRNLKVSLYILVFFFLRQNTNNIHIVIIKQVYMQIETLERDVA